MFFQATAEIVKGVKHLEIKHEDLQAIVLFISFHNSLQVDSSSGNGSIDAPNRQESAGQNERPSFAEMLKRQHEAQRRGEESRSEP